MLATSCNGNFLFVEAGLMENRPVTTSWMFANMFREKYPQVELDMNSILLEQDQRHERGTNPGKVGYTDSSAFTRQFRNHTMLTPKEYRERFSIRA